MEMPEPVEVVVNFDEDEVRTIIVKQLDESYRDGHRKGYWKGYWRGVVVGGLGSFAGAVIGRVLA